MKRLGLALLISILEASIVSAQSSDSLQAVLRRNDIADTTRILILSDLSYNLRRIDPDSSLAMGTEALRLSEKLNYDKGRGRSERMIGIFYYLKGDYTVASDHYMHALAFSEKAKDLKNIASCYNNIGTIYHTQSNYSQALDYFNKSLTMRRQINDQIGIAQCYNNIGSVQHDQGNYEKALEFFSGSLGVCERIKNPEGIASSYNNVGSAYQALGRYDEALKYFLSAVSMHEKRNDKPGIAYSYNNVGNVYKDQGNYEKALEYFFNALRIFEKVDAKHGIAATYTHIGNSYKDQVNYEKALSYFNNSLKIKEHLGDKRGIANSYSDIGSVYKSQHIYQAALEQHSKALKIREEIGDRRGLVQTCMALAEVFIYTREFSKALPYLQKGLSLARETKSHELVASLLTKYAQYFNAAGDFRQASRYAGEALAKARLLGNIERWRDAEEQEYISAAGLGRYLDAFEHHKIFITLRDSIQSEKNIRKLLSNEYAFKEEKARIEQEKKELEYTYARERQKRIAYLLGGVTFAVVVVALVIFRSNLQKRKANRLLTQSKKEIESAKEELEKLNIVKDRLISIISHDVRGPLNSLKGVLYLFRSNALSQTELQDVIVNVGNQVGQISYFLDNLLRWTKDQLEQVKPQPQNLSLAFIVSETVELLSLSAKSKQIHVSSDVPDHLKIFADEEMMKLVLRNLVSNAIKFCRMNDNIHISACAEQDKIRINVKDTGQGIHADNIPLLFGVSHFSTKGTGDEIGTGLGLTLCKEFVEKSGGKIHVTSVEGEGSCFEFTVPCSKE